MLIISLFSGYAGVILLVTIMIINYIIMPTVHRQYNVKYHSAQTIKIKPCICPYWNGGLGNLMVEYASLYGISQLKEMTLVINQNDTRATVFPNIPQVNTTYTTSKPCDNPSVVT